MPTSHERLSIVVDDAVAEALDRAAARRGSGTPRARLARELVLAGDQAERDRVADADRRESERLERAEAAIASARTGYVGLDLGVLARKDAWARP